MKLKGIWVAIAVICVAGIGITDYSARHLAAGETQYVSEETVEKNVSGQAAVVSAVTEAGMAEATKADEGAGSEQAAGAAGSDGIKETAGDAGAAGVLQKAAAGEEAAGAYALSEQRIAADSGAEPLLDSSGILVQDDMPENNADAPGGARITAEKEETQSGTKTGILAQLAELDAQAEERRSASADNSANAMKAVAESERKIWENKLQSILEILEQQLSGDEKTAFFTEQRSWVRDRESTAVANSKKQSGSMLEELEYIRSLRDLTRERVYALAEQYESILDETE